MSHNSKADTPILVVDAFTSEPFRGNPAGVVLLEKPREESWMQALAAEMKHAETAFLVPEDGGFHLRWFTPLKEVDLCGHATLASAHALWETGTLKAGQEARFRTRSGTLTAKQTREGIEMDFPAQPPTPLTGAEGNTICAALGATLGATGCNLGWNGTDYLIEMENEAAVRGLKPDFERIAGVGARGLIVTAASTSSDYDFVSRFFAPAFGIDEDPVTGSAHCCLGPYWGQKLGKTELVGYQASPRGGMVRVLLRGDRVGLIGKAVTVLRGTVAA